MEGEGLEHSYSSVQAIHARWILSAICGYIDVKGGEIQMGPPGFVPTRDMELWDRLPESQWKKMVGANRFRVSSYDTQIMLMQNITRVWGAPVNEMFHQCQSYTPSAYQAIITGDPYPLTVFLPVTAIPWSPRLPPRRSTRH